MQDFSYYLEKIGEIGTVVKINYPIVGVEGLPLVKSGELVLFEEGQMGQVLSVEQETIEILLFSQESVRIGSRVARTDSLLSVPVGSCFLGSVVDPLGKIRSGKRQSISGSERRQVDTPPLGMNTRAKIKKPFLTGVTIVDLMIPLGHGQKELIIGDRKTGKTSFLWSAIKHHVKSGGIAMYAAIARRETDIARIEQFLKNEGLLSQSLVVASAPYDSASLIYLTPFTAMMYAEYFRDHGRNVLLVLDDLTSHAKFYREIALLGRRFPGRDSYPGDIFHTHARLLERAGNFVLPDKKEVSITCLPVAETVEGDLTTYIGTNLMGMTDGHIFFDSNVYYKGRRPSINIALSVTRVGRQTQQKVKRDINREVTAFLALYEKMQNLSHFGAELSETVKHILQTGDRIYNFFDQPYTITVPEEVQLTLFSLLWLNLFEESSVERISEYRKNLTHSFVSSERVQEVLRELTKASSFNGLLGAVAKRKEEMLSLCTTNKE